MKTTAKPAGPVEFAKGRRVVEEINAPFRTICDLTDSEFPVDAEDQHGEFIADAFNVYRETGLTPREIIAQRDGLLNALARLCKVCEFDDIRPHVKGHLSLAYEAIAAIQNASKGGEKG